MNSTGLLKATLINSVSFILISLWLSANAYSSDPPEKSIISGISSKFTSSKEYLSHAKIPATAPPNNVTHNFQTKKTLYTIRSPLEIVPNVIALMHIPINSVWSPISARPVIAVINV